MERRSWLWRRKSLEKDNGEKESCSSLSFQRNSGEAEMGSCPFSEGTVTSTVEENTVQDLTKKLAAALAKIRDKDELVKQHIKVAEEAVSGWEKAEFEIARLKQQLRTVKLKNSILEENIGDLEAALKESIKQFPCTRAEKELKLTVTVTEALGEKSLDCCPLQDSNTPKNEDQIGCHPEQGIHKHLEEVRKENLELKCELFLVSEELQLRKLDVEYGVQIAEKASRLHLENKRKVARLEAECRSLQAFIHRASNNTEMAWTHASSKWREEPYPETEPGSSDTLAVNMVRQHNQLNNHRDIRGSLEFDLMDDFLEMEEFATTLDDNEHVSEIMAGTCQVSRFMDVSGDELEAVVLNEDQMDDKIVVMKSKSEHGMLSTRHEVKLELPSIESEETYDILFAQERELEHLSESDERRDGLNTYQLELAELEIRQLSEKVKMLEQKLENERMLTEELSMQKLQSDISKRMEIVRQRAATMIEHIKFKQEKELSVAAENFSVCQKTIISLGNQLASLQDLIFDDEKMSNEESTSHVKVNTRNLPVAIDYPVFKIKGTDQ